MDTDAHASLQRLEERGDASQEAPGVIGETLGDGDRPRCADHPSAHRRQNLRKGLRWKSC